MLYIFLCSQNIQTINCKLINHRFVGTLHIFFFLLFAVRYHAWQRAYNINDFAVKFGLEHTLVNNNNIPAKWKTKKKQNKN